jgi:hypothetical protein
MIETKITAALSDDITSALIAETEAAITQADADAEAERANALDPIASPDAAKAREALAAAEFARDRLRTVLPRLQQRLTEVAAGEYAAQWEPEFKQVEAQRDALAAEYAELYPKVAAQLIDLFGRIEAVDKEVSRINGSAPYGERRRLAAVELVARGLESFSTSDPPIAKAVQLPDWGHSGRTAWPPPTTPLGVLVSMPILPHPGANWHAALEQRDAARAEEHARVIAHYDAMARQREEREAAEAEARARGM